MRDIKNNAVGAMSRDTIKGEEAAPSSNSKPEA